MKAKACFHRLHGLDKIRAHTEGQQRRERLEEVIQTAISPARNDHFPHLYISSPPGIGKTYTVTKTLHEADIPHFVITGNTSLFAFGVSLAVIAYNNIRAPKVVVVLDDVDRLLTDPESLNTFKNILDGHKSLVYEKNMTLTVQNLSDTQKEAINYFSEEGKMGFVVPTTNMTFIFTSNYPLEKEHDVIRSARLGSKKSQIIAHRNAIRSRVRNFDFNLTDSEHWGWLSSVAIQTDCLVSKGLSQEQVIEILDFIWENWHKINEHSIRTLIKLADIMVAHPEEYQMLWQYDYLN